MGADKHRIGRRKTTIGGQFAPRLIEMLESPAYRSLSLSAHRALSRIEVELAHHGGMNNGSLVVTYDDFREYGIANRNDIARAIRELVAAGFIEITEQGRGGNAEFRSPSKYRLTYRHTFRAEPTHEWKRLSIPEKRKSSTEKRTKPGIGKRTENTPISGTESDTPCSVRNSVLPSISRVDVGGISTLTSLPCSPSYPPSPSDGED